MGRRALTVTICLIAAAHSLATAAQGQRATIAVAVLPFESAGAYGAERDTVERMRREIAERLAAALGQGAGVTVVGPTQIHSELSERQLRGQEHVDAVAAAAIGKKVGAQFVVRGSFVDHYGRFSLNTQIVETESGRILRVVSNADPKLQNRADLPKIVQVEAALIIEEMRKARP
jgi:TolB-like protein